MRPITYGELLAETEQHVVAAIHALHHMTPNAANTAEAIAGHVRLLHRAAGHAAFLATEGRVFTHDAPRRRQAVRAFCDALSPWRHTNLRANGSNEPWHAAAERLAIAHDILATHIGPAHQPRTLDAEVLHKPAAAAQGLRRLAGIVDVAALAAPRLARQAREVTPDAKPELALLEAHSVCVGNAAAALIDVLGDRLPDQRLDRLPPAPLLRLAPPDHADPLGTVAQALDVLGRATLEQLRQPGTSSVATLHVLTATSTSLIGHLELLSAALQPRTSQRENGPLMADAASLHCARAAWIHAGRVLATYPALAPAPRLLTEAALTAQRTLATVTRDGKRWRRPAEIANDPRLTEDVTASLARVVERVALLGPHVAQLAYQCAEHGLLAARKGGLNGLADRRLLLLGWAARGHVPRLLTAADSATRQAAPGFARRVPSSEGSRRHAEQQR